MSFEYFFALFHYYNGIGILKPIENGFMFCIIHNNRVVKVKYFFFFFFFFLRIEQRVRIRHYASTARRP